VEFSYTYYNVGDKTGTLIFSPRGLRHLLIPSSEERVDRWLRVNYPSATYGSDKAKALERKLREYFQGNRVRFDVNLDLGECSTFQRMVYQELMKVPFGSTCSYKMLADAVGVAGGARAVGTALKNNPVPIIIPCHRVIKSDGSLGGFNSGVRWKKKLLELEGAAQKGSGRRG
jgi:methylated-DNA-[protein]-cysteine S-methyltransferase